MKNIISKWKSVGGPIHFSVVLTVPYVSTTYTLTTIMLTHEYQQTIRPKTNLFGTSAKVGWKNSSNKKDPIGLMMHSWENKNWSGYYSITTPPQCPSLCRLAWCKTLSTWPRRQHNKQSRLETGYSRVVNYLHHSRVTDFPLKDQTQKYCSPSLMMAYYACFRLNWQ